MQIDAIVRVALLPPQERLAVSDCAIGCLAHLISVQRRNGSRRILSPDVHYVQTLSVKVNLGDFAVLSKVVGAAKERKRFLARRWQLHADDIDGILDDNPHIEQVATVAELPDQASFTRLFILDPLDPDISWLGSDSLFEVDRLKDDCFGIVGPSAPRTTRVGRKKPIVAELTDLQTTLARLEVQVRQVERLGADHAVLLLLPSARLHTSLTSSSDQSTSCSVLSNS